MKKTCTTIALATLTIGSLAACGSGETVAETSSASSGESSSRAGDCPPEQKGNGLAVSSRYDIEDVVAAQQWSETIPPSSCAGSLAYLVPDAPEGFGLAPASKPYIMNSNQVYLTYAELPDQLVTENGVANYSPETEAVEFEIVRFSKEEISALWTWMEQNEDSYRTKTLDGRTLYLLGGFSTYRPNKPDRLSGGLTAILDNNVLVRVTHRDLYRPNSTVMEPGHIVHEVMTDILSKAEET